MHSNLETIVTGFNEARGGDEDSSKALEGTSDIGKVSAEQSRDGQIKQDR
jgi:hypothetical protein